MKDDVTATAPRSARRFFAPGRLGDRFVLPPAGGLKRLYLRLFGIPDVRAQLSAAYTLSAVQQLAPRTVLDVGCGNGMITCLLAAHMPETRFVGLDLDAASLEFAARLAAQNGLDNVTFRLANAEESALPGSNDMVVCLAVFQFIHDVKGLASQIRDALVPGGSLVLQISGRDTRQYINRLSRLRGNLPEFREVRTGFTDEGVRALLGEVGFDGVETRAVIKGPSILAKEVFYATLQVGPARYALCPLLNWVTAFDRSYSGHGNGIFVVARRSG